MISFKRTFKVALLLAMSIPVVAHAQRTRSSTFIQLTFNFNTQFLQYLSANHITITDDTGVPLQNGTDTFSSTVPGPLDLDTGVNEIITGGGYRVVKGGTTYRILNLISTATDASTINITAYFIVNNQAIGRLPLFVVNGPTLPAPLPNPPNGIEINNSGLNLSLASQAAGIFGGGGPNTQVGTFQVLGILNPNGS